MRGESDSTQQEKGLNNKSAYSGEKIVLMFDSGRKSFIRAIWVLGLMAVFLLVFGVYFLFLA